MIIGILKEIKNAEHRVGLIPSLVALLVQQDHEVMVETLAGLGSGFSDEDYLNAGAVISDSAQEIWNKADLIVKVKEPLPSEYDLIRENQIIFTYLHLASNVELTDVLIRSGAICIAYETVTDSTNQKLPLLSPMSAIAGRMSVLVASYLLQKQFGGCGVLPCGVPGVLPSKVAILGGGVAGFNAAYVARGIGMDVTVFDSSTRALDCISKAFHGVVKTSYSSRANIMNLLYDADIVIGTVLVAGDRTPKLITVDMLEKMKSGSVIVDVSIDQGGCCETSHPTTYDEPFYEVSGIIHYCVPNMPGAYAQTSTISLNNATYPFIEQIANLGYESALFKNPGLKNGLNIFKGKITHEGVARAQNRVYTPF